MKVNWTEAARVQLRDIHTFIARSSPHYAKRTVDRLTRRSQQIGMFPHSGRVVPDGGDVTVREVIKTPYGIIYHIPEDEIGVVAVVHTAQQWPSES